MNEAPKTDLRAREIHKRLAEKLQGELPVLVQPHEVLVALWQGDDVTKGGIYIPDRTKDENIYQGKTGLVIALGDRAFQEDEDHTWPNPPQEGDWVAFRVGDGFPLVLGGREGVHCRLIHESKIRLIVNAPDEVY